MGYYPIVEFKKVLIQPVMVDFDLKNYIPNVKDYPHLEIEREIPHEILRTRYINGSNIWDMNWVSAQEMRRRNRKSS